MSDHADYMRRALAAARVFEGDPQEGEALFEQLFKERPNDGIVHLFYAEAYESAGDAATAVDHFSVAQRECWQENWKERARQGLARVGGRSAAARRLTPYGVRQAVPTQADLEHARSIFDEREPRAAVYDVCAELLAQALQPGARLSVAVPVAALLQSWNFAFYNNGPAFTARHFADLESALTHNFETLMTYRARSIDSIQPADQSPIVSLFAQMETVVGRVGAGKALHLWAPDFFPLWDNPIATAYGFDFMRSGSKAQEYWIFMTFVRQQVDQMAMPSGRSKLKALDEFNYCRFTKKWR